MKIVKKIYRLHWWFWSGGGRPAGVRGCWFSSQMGSPPLLVDCVLSIVTPSKFFLFFFVMKFYFLFVVLNCSLVVIFSC